MPVPEFDLDSLLAKVQKILTKTKPKPPDAATVALCEVVASLVLEVDRLRTASGALLAKPAPEALDHEAREREAAGQESRDPRR